MRKINWLVIHTTATRPSMDIGVKEVRQWHKAKGWSDIGYHYIIRRDGTVEKGRPEANTGAHVAGHNADSIGISMAGGVNERTLKPESNYTQAQWSSLEGLLHKLVQKYPDANVTGHRDFPGVAKACPCFDAEPWAASKGFRTRGKGRQWVRELKGSRTLVGASMSAGGGSGLALQDTANQLAPLAEYSKWIGIISAVLLVAGTMLVVFARWSDAKSHPKFDGEAAVDESR